MSVRSTLSIQNLIQHCWTCPDRVTEWLSLEGSSRGHRVMHPLWALLICTISTTGNLVQQHKLYYSCPRNTSTHLWSDTLWKIQLQIIHEKQRTTIKSYLSARKFPCWHFSEDAVITLNLVYATGVDKGVLTAQTNKTQEM